MVHSPLLGALELRVALVAGKIGVGVTTEKGKALSLATEAQADLVARLEAVTGLPSAVGVAGRTGPPPEPPVAPTLPELRLYA